ncbi:unnamed protein product [Adineta ricciae]|nr:unnamed protein product [Adineta ricciae]
MAAPPRTWPNLVGKDGKEAVEIIKKDTGFTNVHTIEVGMKVTMDYRTDRVRVRVDKQGQVASTPIVG